MRPDHLLFLHIPKTAGTTLHNLLSRQFPRNAQLETNFYKDKNQLERIPAAEREKIRLVRGHFLFGLHELFPAGTCEYTTVLREPIDRCISNYYFVRRKREDFKSLGAKPISASLLELCRSGEFVFVDNMQVRFLSGDYNAPFGSLTEAHYEAAVQHLEKHFPVVGIQENFEAYVLWLSDRYRFRFPYYRQHRVNRTRPAVRQIDEETIAALRACNQLDLRLYALVREKVLRQIEAGGPAFQRRIERFKKTNHFVARTLDLLPFYPKVDTHIR